MIRRVTALICVTAVALCAAANAQQSTLKKGDHGLSDVVKRECGDIRWTSEVMMLSKIDSSELSLLKVGRPITVPNNCATLAPSKKVKKATLRIFKQEKLLLQVRKGGLPPNPNETKITKKNFEDAVNKALQPLTIENTKLKADKIAAEGKAKVEKGKNSSAKWEGAGIGAVVGAVIAFFVFWFLTRLLRKNNHNLSEKISSLEEELEKSNKKQDELRARLAEFLQREVQASSILFHGKKVEFADTSEHWVGCPFCSEKRIRNTPQNMYAHLNKHIRLRVVWVSPEEMSKKLAASNELFVS